MENGMDRPTGVAILAVLAGLLGVLLLLEGLALLVNGTSARQHRPRCA